MNLFENVCKKNMLILFAISEIINFVNYKVLCVWPNAFLLNAKRKTIYKFGKFLVKVQFC